jgi:dTDP-4-dehydrorhamnose reductase
MSKKKILITGAHSMLAYDFIRMQSEIFDIIPVWRSECDIISFESILQSISLHEPDLILNCAAYTAVDDAEDVGFKNCFDVNTIWSFNLARATSAFGIDLITISTDYVFDGKKSEWYFPSDICSPINAYGMSKYLWEKLSLEENRQSIIIRTSWLYGWNPYGSEMGVFKNFVNTMLRISETRDELSVVNDQFGIPTSCQDLSHAISQVIQDIDKDDYRWQILHFSNSCEEWSITWANFAKKIFELSSKNVKVIDCESQEYPTKAKRPNWSVLKNNSNIILPDWKNALKIYLKGK